MRLVVNEGVDVAGTFGLLIVETNVATGKVIAFFSSASSPGCPGEGDCLEPNGTPGCEDELCCDTVCVADTGKGIPADEIPTLFDEYRQVEGSESGPLGDGLAQKGTGLGLSITKKFAELLGGSVSVTSEIGKGSTFTIRVPVDYTEPS